MHNLTAIDIDRLAGPRRRGVVPEPVARSTPARPDDSAAFSPCRIDHVHSHIMGRAAKSLVLSLMSRNATRHSSPVIIRAHAQPIPLAPLVTTAACPGRRVSFIPEGGKWIHLHSSARWDERREKSQDQHKRHNQRVIGGAARSDSKQQIAEQRRHEEGEQEAAC